MNVYKLEKNKINGINIPENSIICTIQEKITIRLIGESTPFIEAELEEFRNSSDETFATLDAFITYFNLNFNTGISLEAADIQIGAVELKDASTTQRATITLVGSKGALATQVVDAAGNQITSFGSPSTVADYHLSAVYASSSTLTLTIPGGLSIVSPAQIVYIRQFKSTSTIAGNTYVNGASGYSFGYSGGLITIYKDGVATGVFNASGDSYEVGVNSIVSLIETIANSAMPVHATHFSPVHFTVAYTTTATITCTPLNGFPDIDSGIMNVMSIVITDANNIPKTFLSGKNGVSFTATSNVISVYQNGVQISPFAATDLKYRVSLSYAEDTVDLPTGSQRNFVQNFPVQPIGDVLLNAIVSTTPSAGSNLTVVTTVTAAGAVKTAAIAVAGTGYAVSSTLYAYLGGGNNDAIISITTNSSGVPTAITLITGGSGYVASATASTTIVVINYYPSSDGLDIGSYKDLSIHYQTNTATGTVTTAIEASDEDTPTKWYNITKTGFISGGVQANTNGLNSIVNEDGFIDFDNLQRKKFRIRSMTTAGTVVPLYYSYQLKGV